MPSMDGADNTHVPQLLKADGSYFSALVYVRNYLPPYTASYFQVQPVGTNATAFAAVGDPQDVIDGFTIEVFGAGAYREVKEAIGKESTHGYMILRVPDISDTTSGDSYLIRFYEAQMGRLYPRRDGYVQIFSADVSGPIEVHGHETY